MSRVIIFLGSLTFLFVFFANSVQSGQMHVNSAKACASMNCGRGENCVNRRFWCKNPPCPSMLYCSKTARESLQGPTTCKSVRCSKGYICLVRVHRCRWDQRCRQQITRCVSELEYYDGPASCADFRCPSGHECILRESACVYPPCKLVKSCAKSKDVEVWHGRCRTLGCPSAYECFLRKPSDNCLSTNSCKHTPDCTINNFKKVLINPNCRGWVCPRYQVCSALVPKFCNPDEDVENCKINRACHGPSATSNMTSSPSTSLIPWTPTTATNNQDRIWRTKNFELALVPTETYHQDAQHRPDHPAIQTTSLTEDPEHELTPNQTNCNLNKSASNGDSGMQLEKWNPESGSIYRTPIYVRSTVNENYAEAEKSPCEERPTDNSTTHWLDYLRLKTGVDAINVWATHAEENRQYGQFKEWLASVKATLGPFRFEIWLREIKKITSDYPAFQKWITTNEKIPSSTKHQTNNRNNTQNETSTVVPEQNKKLPLESDQALDRTESSVRDHETLMYFHPFVKSENDSLTFSVDKEIPNLPLKKNTGHTRINYGRNRDYKHHRDFGPGELRNRTITWYGVNNSVHHLRTQQHKIDNNGTKIEYFATPELQRKIENNPSQDYPVDSPMQHHTVNHSDHKNNDDTPNLGQSLVKISNQRNNSVKNDSVPLQTNLWNDGRLKDGVLLDNLKNPPNKAEVRKPEDHVSINKNENAQVPLGLNNFGQKIKDQNGSRSGLDSSSLFNNVKNPEWNSDPQKHPALTDPRQFTVEDQIESWKGFEFPDSVRRLYYEMLHELEQKYSENNTRPRNPSVDIGPGREGDLKKMYNLFAPAADDLHIISPWDGQLPVVDHEKRSHNTPMGFPLEQANNRLRISGYPAIVSRASSADQPNIFSQNQEDLVDISPNSKSDKDSRTLKPPNSWSQILHHRLLPPLTLSPDYPTLDEQRQLISTTSQQAQIKLQNQEQNTQKLFYDVQNPSPRSKPLRNWYQWDERTPEHLSEISQVSPVPKDPYITDITNIGKSLKKSHGTLSSKGYVDAYVDALIKDALSEVILSEQLQVDEHPVNWKTSKNLGLFDEGFEGKHLSDTVQRAKFSEKNTSKNAISTDEKYEGNSMKDVLTSEQHITITPIPESPIHSTIAENDYQYDCEDHEMNPPEGMEFKESLADEDAYGLGSASDELQEYYSEDSDQQEYIERPSMYQDEYLGEVETNSTDYDFYYHLDEEYDKVVPEKN